MDKQKKWENNRFHHNYQCNRIKKALKGKCTFISLLNKSSGTYMRVYMKNELGGKDKIDFKMGSSFKELRSSDYDSLLNVLENGKYTRG